MILADHGGQQLAGNVAGVVRIGDTVRRQVGPWTPAVQALLGHLAGRLRHVPRVHGLDEHDREVLDFLPGRVVDVDTERLSEGQIHSLVGWTRDLRAAAAGFSHPGPWRLTPPSHATVIGHNDLAPYNACFDADEVTGVFDWYVASPTTPLAELAFLAWNCVPLLGDLDEYLAARRLGLIARTYGGVDAGGCQPRPGGAVQGCDTKHGCAGRRGSGEGELAAVTAGPARDGCEALLEQQPDLHQPMR